MPSIGTYKAQPVTRTFAITQGPDQTGVYYFTPSDVESWYTANSSNVTKVSEGLYIVTSSDFQNVVYNGSNPLENSGTYSNRKSLLDFGKEIIIGNTVNSRLLVLRRVQIWDDASVGGDGREFYIVTENNTYDLAPGGYGRFTVRVARN